jgi:diketogulonate reductase-like aldo/keto reductase
MNVKELERTGVFIPEVGIGTWEYHAGPGPLRKGLEAGALFIDTAESYGTEEVVAEAIRGMHRQVFVATKVSPQNFRPEALKRSTEGSLRRLGIDIVNLLQLHAPSPQIPIEETMGAISELVDAGKVRFIGVSNFSVAQMQEAQRALSKHRIVSNQVRYNLIDRTIEKDLLPFCQANQVTVIAYSPLARGLGRILDCDPRGIIGLIARDTGRSKAQIAINWCLCRDRIVAIPKGNSEEHILDNCAATDWHLSSEQIRLLDENIQYRHRNTFDLLLRRYMPSSLRQITLQAVKYLPRGLRRRIT